MSTTEGKPIQAKEKRDIRSAAEQTTAGPTFTPPVDIFETEKEITLQADIPGVKVGDLTIDIHENTLTITGKVQPPESPEEREIFREYDTGKYYRQFTLSSIIDQAKIDAKLSDGVLRLTLPKAEKTVPRKIDVKAV